MKSAYGNINIQDCFDELRLKFKFGDTFTLFFDNVESINGEPVSMILLNIKEVCDSLVVDFRHTTYYCFEELFLTYEGAYQNLH